MGPVGCYWEFVTERWCGYLTQSIRRSGPHPWSTLANFVRDTSRLHAIKVLHNLEDGLAYSSSDRVGKRDMVYSACKPPFSIFTITQLLVNVN